MGQLSLDKVNPMNFKSQLSSHIVSVWVTLYIAVFLNALIFWRHLDIRSETSIAVTALSVVGFLPRLCCFLWPECLAGAFIKPLLVF